MLIHRVTTTESIIECIENIEAHAAKLNERIEEGVELINNGEDGPVTMRSLLLDLLQEVDHIGTENLLLKVYFNRLC